jgi:hypothetical protein
MELSPEQTSWLAELLITRPPATVVIEPWDTRCSDLEVEPLDLVVCVGGGCYPIECYCIETSGEFTLLDRHDLDARDRTWWPREGDG